MTKRIKVVLPINDFAEDQDDNVDSFGILAAGLHVKHTSLVLQFEGWLETTFQVEEDRLIAVLDCINALTIFEAEVING